MKHQYLKEVIFILLFFALINSCKKIHESPPVADFKVNSEKFYTGVKIYFTDLSTNEPNFWLWDFGDGTKSNKSNPSHMYSSTGSFTVTLKVSNEAGIDTLTKSNFISVIYKPCPDITTVTDIDSNEYKTVLIGDQCWMAENLKTTKYNDGVYLTYRFSNKEWYEKETPAYCWYNNNYDKYGEIYGALYNWYAVNTGKLCPAGWRVPTKDEWSILSDFLGGSSEAGSKLKQSGTKYWESPNSEASNITGFTALPGGYRSGYDGLYNNIKSHAYFWTATERPGSIASWRAWYISLSFKSKAIEVNDYSNEYGKSVRCVKD